MLKKEYKEKVLDMYSTHIVIKEIHKDKNELVADLLYQNEISGCLTLASDRYYPINDILNNEEMEEFYKNKPNIIDKIFNGTL